MTQNDQMKLLNAGYTLIRRDYVRMAIKQKTTHRFDWHNLVDGFTTKKALNDRASELLIDKKIIEDTTTVTS